MHDNENVVPKSQYLFPLATSLNVERCAMNRRLTMDYCKNYSCLLYQIKAEPSDKKNSSTIESLSGMNDDYTDKTPLVLSFYFGMPIMITKRMKEFPEVEALKVIANGTIAFIINTSNHDNEGEEFETHWVDGIEVKRFTAMSKLLWIQIRGFKSILIPGIPPGVFGLPPLTQSVKISV
jgi:hypothetical protein